MKIKSDNREMIQRASILVLVFTIVSVSVLFSNFQEAQATHFRFGHISWVPGDELGEIEFRILDSFRRGYAGSDPDDGGLAVGDVFTETIGSSRLTFGDGESTDVLMYKVDAINKAENWVFAHALDPETGGDTIFHTYTNPDEGPFVAEIESCCRTSGEANNPDGQYQVSTEIDFSVFPNQSPVSTNAPIIFCEIGEECNFTIPAVDADEDTLSFGLSSSEEAGSNFIQPGNQMDGTPLKINDCGTVSWFTSGTSVGQLWSNSIRIVESRGMDEIGFVMLDYLIKIVETGELPDFNSDEDCSNPNIDDDTDGDGIPDGEDPAPFNPCIPDANSLACDTDGDGIPDGTDTDDDGDGVPDDIDDAPLDPCIPDAASAACDTDGDGFDNDNDPAPLDPCIPDANALACIPEGDGNVILQFSPQSGTIFTIEVGNTLQFPMVCEINQNHDLEIGHLGLPPGATLNVVNGNPALALFSFTPTEVQSVAIAFTCTDTFSNVSSSPLTITVNVIQIDDDDDNDGIPDGEDPAPLDPCNPNPNALACDTDGDGIPDGTDTDDDGDGVIDGEDPAPLDPCNPNPNALACDTDGDGIPDGTNENSIVVSNIEINEGDGGGDGYIPLGPTMGRDHLTGNKVVTGGFGIDGELVDVEGWYTPHGWNRDPGTHTFTMKIYSELGLDSLTEVQLLTSIIGTWDANNPIWKITLDKNFAAGTWDITVIDEQNLIGDATVTALELDNRYNFFSVTITDMDPTPDNVAIGVRMIDDIFGMSTAWFNEGLTIKDTFAYLNMQNGFEENLNAPLVCTEQEDPENRYSCAFEQKEKTSLAKAEETFIKYYGDRVYNVEEPVNSKLLIQENPEIIESKVIEQTINQPIIEENHYLNFKGLKDYVEKPYLNSDLLKKISERIYLNFDALGR